MTHLLVQINVFYFSTLPLFLCRNFIAFLSLNQETYEWVKIGWLRESIDFELRSPFLGTDWRSAITITEGETRDVKVRGYAHILAARSWRQEGLTSSRSFEVCRTAAHYAAVAGIFMQICLPLYHVCAAARCPFIRPFFPFAATKRKKKK